MSKASKPNVGLKEARPFMGMSQAHAQAAVATAYLIARVVCRMLKYKVEYEPLSVIEYEQHYREQQLKYYQKKAAKFGFQLVPA